MSKSNPHKNWDTPLGVIANVVVGLVILAVTVLNVMEGAWIYVGLALLVVAGFGVAPALAAHRDGVLWSGRARAQRPSPGDRA